MLSKIAPQIGALSIFALLFFDAICNLKIMTGSVIDFFENPFTVKSVSGQTYLWAFVLQTILYSFIMCLLLNLINKLV